MLQTFNKHDWVLKSAIGYGGNGVFCGWEMDEAQWQEKLLHAANSSENKDDNYSLHILQKRVHGDNNFSISMTPSGVLIDSNESKVLGLFTVQGNFGGGFIRQSLSGEGVISNTNNASIGVMRVSVNN